MTMASKSGRPTKLTPIMQQKLIDELCAGNYRDTAAKLAGIHRHTFRNWIKRGEAAKRGIFFDFVDAIKKAEAEGEARRVARINRAGEDGNWQADAWFLERKYPDKWGRKDAAKLELTGEVKTSDTEYLTLIQQILVETLDPEVSAKVSDRLMRIAKSGISDESGEGS